MVPIENSVEGTVNATVDTLGFETDDLFIEREVILAVRLHLLGRPGTVLGEVTEVISMPHATAQCRRWLRENLPDAKVVAANSTAEAAQQWAAGKRKFELLPWLRASQEAQTDALPIAA